MSKIDLSTYRPIVSLEDNLVFANNGNLILAYEAQLPEIYSQSEQAFEAMHDMWFQGFKNLPIGTIVHKQDIYQKQKFKAKDLPRATFLARATHDYFKGRDYMTHRCLLFFVLTKNNTLNNAKYSNPFRKVSEDTIQELNERTRHFKEAVTDAVSYINNGQDIKLRPLNPEEIQSFSRAYFNGFNTGYDTDILLDSSTADGHIAIGEHYFDVLAVNSELCFGEAVQTSKPNEQFTSDDFIFHQGFTDGLGLVLHADHIVNQILYLDDKHKWRKLLEKRVEQLSKSARFGSQNKVALAKVQHILDTINTDDNARIIRGHFNVVYWAKAPTQLKRIRSKIKTEFKELDITPYYPNGKERKNYFLNSYFCFSSNFSDYDLFVTDLKHALCLFIGNTAYKSDPKGILFNSRVNNTPVLKDVWDDEKTRIKARNFALFAPTGEGKSFLANNILRQYFESGVRLVIIDLGGSYTKFAKLYPDDHAVLRYERGKSLGINPFYIKDKEDLTPQRLEELSVFLLELFAADKQAGKAQSVALKKILQDYYANTAARHSLDSFYRYIAQRKDKLLPRLDIHPDYFNMT